SLRPTGPRMRSKWPLLRFSGWRAGEVTALLGRRAIPTVVAKASPDNSPRLTKDGSTGDDDPTGSEPRRRCGDTSPNAERRRAVSGHRVAACAGWFTSGLHPGPPQDSD